MSKSTRKVSVEEGVSNAGNGDDVQLPELSSIVETIAFPGFFLGVTVLPQRNTIRHKCLCLFKWMWWAFLFVHVVWLFHIPTKRDHVHMSSGNVVYVTIRTDRFLVSLVFMIATLYSATMLTYSQRNDRQLFIDLDKSYRELTSKRMSRQATRLASKWRRLLCLFSAFQMSCPIVWIAINIVTNWEYYRQFGWNTTITIMFFYICESSLVVVHVHYNVRICFLCQLSIEMFTQINGKIMYNLNNFNAGKLNKHRLRHIDLGMMVHRQNDYVRTAFGMYALMTFVIALTLAYLVFFSRTAPGFIKLFAVLHCFVIVSVVIFMSTLIGRVTEAALQVQQDTFFTMAIRRDRRTSKTMMQVARINVS